MKACVGYIYRYSYNGKSYIGSTTDIKKRQEEHKQNNTNKFGRAIKEYGYNNFTFEILETKNYSEREELFDLEDYYINKYDTVSNGWNWRKNTKQQE